MILTDLKDNVFTITLNRPDKSNAWTLEMIEEFVAELYWADANKDVRVLLITGNGKHFCAGGDIHKMQNQEEMFAGEPNELRERYHRGIQKIPRAFIELSTPTIAAINGAAIGAGLDLACMCDIRVAAPKAKFGETFSNLGLIPGDGGSYFFQRVVGFAKAMELSLTGKVFDVAEAKAIGLLTYSGEDFLEYANKLALEIAQKPPIATQMLKRSIENAYNTDLNSHLNLLAAYQGITQRTQDHFNALKSMVDKKSGKFEHK